MAFGKNPADLKRVSDFRQAGRVSDRKFPKRSGGGGFRFANNFKPSTVEPDVIRFIPGEYPYTKVNDDGSTEDFTLPYARFAEHYDGRTKGSSICSAGPFVMYKNKRDACIGCDLFWAGGGKKDGRVSRREMYSFSVVNYGTFHEVDQIDQDGHVRMNDKTNKPYTQWVRCTGRRCDACAAQKPTKKGHMQHWEMGMGHFTALTDYAKLIGRSCKNCKGKNTIQPLAYLCPHCKEAVIDMSTTTFSDEEIAKMIDQETSCPHCRQSGYLEEVIECSNCPGALRAGIFDVDIHVKRIQGEGNQTSLHFTEYGVIADIDPKYDAKPLDLGKMYEPSSLEYQSNKFKEPIPATVPRQPVPASQVARPYAGQTPPPAPHTSQWPAQTQAQIQTAQAAPAEQPKPRTGGMFGNR